MRLGAKGFTVVTFEAGNELCPLCLYFVISRGQSAIYPNKSYNAAFQARKLWDFRKRLYFEKTKPAHANRVRRLKEQC
jgi:hypothetical protein